MHNHTKSHKKRMLLAALTVIVLVGVSLFFAGKPARHSGSYEFQNVAPYGSGSDSAANSAAPAERSIPVAPGPATPGPEMVPTVGAAGNSDQEKTGVPVMVAGQNPQNAQTTPTTPSAMDRKLAMTPGGGIADGPHGIPNNEAAEGVPVIVDQPKTEATKEVAAPTCFTFTYKHKPTPGHDSEEACSHHKNLIHLAHKNVNPGSLCVRVNGKPVHFTSPKEKPDDVVIGAVAGPRAVITASYCTGGVKCAQSCKVPKDEFLDAIGGTAADGEDGLAMGQWQQLDGDAPEKEKDAKLVAGMKKELNGIDGQEGTGDGYTLFQGWIADAGTPSCGNEVARISAHSKKGD